MLQFNDTSTHRGIVQIYEKEIGANRTDISGNTDKLKELTADVNLAFDDFTAIAVQAGGTHQWDDSNHTDYPIIRTAIVSGQRDYSLTTDGSSNLILDIYKVRIADASGNWIDLTPVDVQSERDTLSFSGTTTGMPYRYDKTANGIFLDPIPNYSRSASLEIYINREASYFAYTDTTKKPGVPGIFHRYFAIRPAEDYARRNNLTNYNKLVAERLAMEQSIREYFGLRQKDKRTRLSAGTDSNK